MSTPARLALLAAALLAPATAHALDDGDLASSSGFVAMTFCGQNADGSKLEGGTSKFCKANGYDKLAATIETSFAAALAKAPANVRPLFKRDQAWFNEMIQEATYASDESDDAELHKNMADTLRQRAAVLASSRAASVAAA